MLTIPKTMPVSQYTFSCLKICNFFLCTDSKRLHASEYGIFCLIFNQILWNVKIKICRTSGGEMQQWKVGMCISFCTLLCVRIISGLLFFIILSTEKKSRLKKLKLFEIARYKLNGKNLFFPIISMQLLFCMVFVHWHHLCRCRRCCRHLFFHHFTKVFFVFGASVKFTRA